MADEKKTVWVISNRKDDRVVLFERDPAHPGGEAFVGGSTPAEVARTGSVERLLHQGLLVEIPEPPDGRKKPIAIAPAESGPPAAQPGHPIPLGREMDPELVPADSAKAVLKRQEGLPDEVPAPAGATVPPPAPGDKDTRRT